MPISNLCDIIPAWPGAMNQDGWHEQRTKGIGGSDVATICNLNPYQDAYTLWHLKRGDISRFEGNEATELGNDLEPVVAKRWAKQTNRTLIEWPVMLRSKAEPWMLANCDRFVAGHSTEKTAGQVLEWFRSEDPPDVVAIWEGKTGAIATPGKAHEWFTDGDSIPIGYALQGQWYLAVTGLDVVEYGALIGHHGLLTRTMERDDETIAMITETCREFWKSVVNGYPEPEPTGNDSSDEALKELYPVHEPGSVCVADDELIALLDELADAKEAFNAAEERKKAARNQVVTRIKSAEVVVDADGKQLATFRATKDGTYFAEAILEQEHPETYKQYLRTKKGYRVLKPKK